MTFGGEHYISEYGSSSQLISNSFPTYEWLPWKFRDSVNYWEDPVHIHQYMQWLFRHKKFTQMNDWYQIQAKVTRPQNLISSLGFRRYWRLQSFTPIQRLSFPTLGIRFSKRKLATLEIPQKSKNVGKSRHSTKIPRKLCRIKKVQKFG